jgi:hypothetical protein
VARAAQARATVVSAAAPAGQVPGPRRTALAVRPGHAACSPGQAAGSARPGCRGTPGGRGRVAEDQHVLVHDQVPGLAAAAGLAEVVELEERGPGDQPAVAQPGEQGNVPGDRGQAGAGAGGEDGGGQVDEFPVLPPGPGGDDGEPGSW